MRTRYYLVGDDMGTMVLMLIGFLFSGCGITLITLLHRRRKKVKQEREARRKKERELLTEAQKILWGKKYSHIQLPTPEEATRFSEQQAIVAKIRKLRDEGKLITIKIAYRYSLRAEDWRMLFRLLWFYLKDFSLKYAVLKARSQILRGFIEPLLKSIWR